MWPQRGGSAASSDGAANCAPGTSGSDSFTQYDDDLALVVADAITTAGFMREIFPGGHFYLAADPARVVARVLAARSMV